MDSSTLAAQAKDAAKEMVVFARVLEVTRANLNVMTRLRELRGIRLEYGKDSMPGWVPTETEHGDN